MFSGKSPDVRNASVATACGIGGALAGMGVSQWVEKQIAGTTAPASVMAAAPAQVPVGAPAQAAA